jgi:hypothetical protein
MLKRIGADGASQVYNKDFVEIPINDAPNIIFTKNMGVHNY